MSNQTVPFVLQVEKKEYRQLLEQLPTVTLAFDEDELVQTLTRRLANEGLTPTDEQTLESVARELCRKTIRPFLEPRIRAFNDLINRQATAESVSAGFIAFDGLASQAADASTKASGVLVLSRYKYREDAIQDGNWSEPSLSDSGMNNLRFLLNASIDEQIELDLRPYGKERVIPWRFCSEGSVVLKQTYDSELLSTKPDGPSLTVRLRPKATVVVEKNVDPGVYFRIDGDRQTKLEKTFQHPAIHEIQLVSEGNE